MNSKNSVASIPQCVVGPIKIVGPEIDDEVNVPLVTFETPLWPSVGRGARISRLTDGIKAVIVSECMTRSVLVEAPDAIIAAQVMQNLEQQTAEMQTIAHSSSRFVQFKNFQAKIIGNLLYLRFAFTTGNAAGHNMVTKAAEALQNWLLTQYKQLKYVSISGNYCVDKKVSAVNGILGRGKYVVAEILIPQKICVAQLRVTPDKLVNLNIKKNLLGSIAAGSVHSANAHYANMLLALYLATGQDAANIVEGSQGITHTELRDDDLYFSVTIPNIIVGTVGAKKNLAFVQENLKLLNCLDSLPEGHNSRRLALIAAATVLCGELSLLAAQTNRGELMQSHVALER